MLVVRSSSMHFLISTGHVYICNHVVALAQVKVGIRTIFAFLYETTIMPLYSRMYRHKKKYYIKIGRQLVSKTTIMKYHSFIASMPSLKEC